MDILIKEIINKERLRQENTLTLIPSENHTSSAVLEVVGSCLSDKYAEGYPHKRYYQGNAVMDELEEYVQMRAREIFDLEWVNVQPYSGSPANLAVYLAVLSPGEKVLGLNLSSGGHLTHGHDVSITGKWFKSFKFGLDTKGFIDYEQMERVILEERPKLVVVGSTSYPWRIDWEKVGKITSDNSCILLADISHTAGLIAGKTLLSPSPFVDVVMTTTHKTLRGPRGAILGVTKRGMTKDSELAKKIEKAVFPGLQGGPHMNTIAGIGQALYEVGDEGYKEYCERVLSNAIVLSGELKRRGFVVWGTDTHLMVVDVGVGKGREVAKELEKVGVVVNANTIPGDKGTPLNPSGIRIGTPAITTRGLGEEEMKIIAEVIDHSVNRGANNDLLDKITTLCKKYPVIR